MTPHSDGSDGRVDADRLVRRAGALRDFVHAADGVVDADRLAPARELGERAGQRLALSRDHTVVALAGPTGSGKSSLFNTLTGLRLSEVGPLRPTTGQAHACVWGGQPLTGAAPTSSAAAGAGQLLDWLGIRPALRFQRESALDADDQVALRGLVLLDMPDFDSLAGGHRTEVDRLLDLVDLVVWVTDPQKYADQVIHERYLRTFHRHREMTLVVLNQADRLSTVDVSRCVSDLRRLLEADGLSGVPVLPTVAVNGPEGVAQLRGELEKAVSGRQSSLRRLGTDLDEVVDGLSTVVGPPARRPEPDEVLALTGALADAVAVPALVNAVGDSYRYRARRAMTWPPLRAFPARPDPLAQLRTERAGAPAGPAEPAKAQRSAARLAARTLGDRTAAGLPEPWASAITAAARSRLNELPYALDKEVGRTKLSRRRTPAWCRLIGGLQWLLLAAAVGGAGWLLAGYLLARLGNDHLRPALLAGAALLAGLLLPVLTLPLVTAGTRRARRRATSRLQAGLSEVTSELVLRPVSERVDRYAAAREALETARR